MARKAPPKPALMLQETTVEKDLPPSKDFANLTKRQQDFLRAFYRYGVLSHACRVIGISRTAYHLWSQPVVIASGEGAGTEVESPFSKALLLVKQMIMDKAEATLQHLALDGYDRPIYYRGRCVGFQREYVPDLLKFYLRANKPDKYTEKRQVEVGNLGDKPFVVRSAEPATPENWQDAVAAEMGAANASDEEDMPE